MSSLEEEAKLGKTTIRLFDGLGSGCIRMVIDASVIRSADSLLAAPPRLLAPNLSQNLIKYNATDVIVNWQIQLRRSWNLHPQLDTGRKSNQLSESSVRRSINAQLRNSQADALSSSVCLLAVIGRRFVIALRLLNQNGAPRLNRAPETSTPDSCFQLNPFGQPGVN